MSARANRKQAQNNQAITKTLNLSGDYAFKLLRKGKWRRAENMAQDLLSELPPSMRKSADALCLRMIGKAGRYIADWFAAEDASRKRKKQTRRTSRASGEVVPMALATSHLLLVPEYPMVPNDSPAEVGEKQ